MGRHFNPNHQLNRGHAERHRELMAQRNLEVIPAGARVAYCDASGKDGLVRAAVVIAEEWPDVEVVAELTIDPGTSNVNEGELAAIVAAAEFNPDYIITDSLTSIEKMNGMYKGIPVVYVPGKTGLVPGHDRTHDLATEARQKAEED